MDEEEDEQIGERHAKEGENMKGEKEGKEEEEREEEQTEEDRREFDGVGKTDGERGGRGEGAATPYDGSRTGRR